jgi:hypothetical protein
MLLVMIQSADEPGMIRVTAESEGLQSATVVLAVAPGAAPRRVGE